MRPSLAAAALGVVFLSATVAPAQQKKRGAAPAAAPKATIGVAGVKVRSASFRENSSDVGTRVALSVQVTAPNGIVSIDSGESTVTEMRDSAGLVLDGPEVAYSSNIAKNGKAAMVEVRSDEVPGAQAKSVSAKGTLAVTVATGVRTEKVPVVKLEKGATFKLAGATLTVDKVEADGESQTVTFKGPVAPFRALKEIRFLEGGQPVEASGWGRGFMGDEGEATYRTAVKGKTASLAVDMWQNQQTLSVPFDVQVGLVVGGR
jgi:hypothetical protein